VSREPRLHRKRIGRRHGSTPRQPTHRLLRAGSVIGVAVALGLLAVEVYLIGHGPKVGLGKVPDAVAAAVTRPTISVVFALLCVLLGGTMWRQLWFMWLAYSPGPIQVIEFDAADVCGEVDAHALTTVFRARLSQLSLHAPNPVPGAARERALLDVLGESSDIGTPAALARLARAGLPSHTYEVHGTLQRRERQEWSPSGERCRRLEFGLTTQVLRLPSEGTVPSTAWADSWEEVVLLAADEAMAAILPRTRLCRHQWAGWRGRVMPPGLLVAYERGFASEQAECFEEGLAHYYQALEKDPFNLAIRLQVGQLHERAGNIIEAFATYHAIVEVTRPAGQDLPTDLYSRPARRERERVISIARYRRALTLGSSTIAAAWSDGRPRNDDLTDMIVGLAGEHRSALLPDPEEPLRPGVLRRRPSGETLEQVLGSLQSDSSRPGDQDRWLEHVETLLRAPSPHPNGGRQELPVDEDRLSRLGVLFAAVGLAAMQRLTQSRRLTSPQDSTSPGGGFGQAQPFTSVSLLLSTLAVRLRLAQARDAIDETSTSRLWRRELASLDNKVNGTVGQRVEQWHDAYIAACVYSIPLLNWEALSSGERARLARRAVEWIEMATARADSAFVGARREWLLVEDPDLAKLRETPQFKAWTNIYFPGSTAVGAEQANRVPAAPDGRSYASSPPT